MIQVRHKNFRSIPTLSVILILTLAVGVATPIFSLINSILLKPLSFSDPDRLVVLNEANFSEGKPLFSVSYENYMDWKRQTKCFESLTACRSGFFLLTTENYPRRIHGAYIDEDFFNVFGGQLLFGRMPQPGELDVVLLSHQLWQSSLGGKKSALGSDLELSGKSYKVIGVTNTNFDKSPFLSTIQLLAPLEAEPDYGWERDERAIKVFGKLKEGISLSQAQSELDAIAANLEKEYPASNKGWTVRINSLFSWFVDDSIVKGLWLLGGVAVFAVLVAWLNMTILLVSIGLARRKELAIRSALGATPGRLSIMLAKEILLPCLLASTIGMLLSYWVLMLLRHLDPGVPRLQEVSFDWTALFTAAFLTILNTAVAAVFTWKMTRGDFASDLKDAGRGVIEGGGKKKQTLVVIGEIALAFALVAATLSSFGDLVRLQKTDLGFEIENVYMTQIILANSRYASDEVKTRFFNNLESRLKQFPFLKNVGLATTIPLTGGGDGSFIINQAGNEAAVEALLQEISPGYLRTMGIPLLAGRSLLESDRSGNSTSALINQALALRLGGYDNAVGVRLNADTFFDSWPEMDLEVVGVVEDVKQVDLLSEVSPEIYIPFERAPRGGMYLVVNSNANSGQIARTVRNVIREMDKDLVINDFYLMEDILNLRFFSQPRFGFLTLALLALLAVGSAIGGLYGAITYQVNLRHKEFGIRMSLGADRLQIFKLVIGWGLRITAIGLAIGIMIVFALTTWVASILPDTGAANWKILTMASLFLVLVTLAIISHPAWKAASVQPIEVIKEL